MLERSNNELHYTCMNTGRRSSLISVRCCRAADQGSHHSFCGGWNQGEAEKVQKTNKKNTQKPSTSEEHQPIKKLLWGVEYDASGTTSFIYCSAVEPVLPWHHWDRGSTWEQKKRHQQRKMGNKQDVSIDRLKEDGSGKRRREEGGLVLKDGRWGAQRPAQGGKKEVWKQQTEVTGEESSRRTRGRWEKQHENIVRDRAGANQLQEQLLGGQSRAGMAGRSQATRSRRQGGQKPSRRFLISQGLPCSSGLTGKRQPRLGTSLSTRKVGPQHHHTTTDPVEPDLAWLDTVQQFPPLATHVSHWWRQISLETLTFFSSPEAKWGDCLVNLNKHAKKISFMFLFLGILHNLKKTKTKIYICEQLIVHNPPLTTCIGRCVTTCFCRSLEQFSVDQN